MEDDATKAPLTRLRRKLSADQSEDTNSPSAPSTPTKKRPGRLAAKPLLDNIDENAQVSSPKPTRRRSTTADLTEEEKPMTPSRRSSRIRSNTSITLEKQQIFESPRAKRVARRNSQAGSDNEATSTPVRVTRRGRKDSTSSINNPFESTKQITQETIIEDPESQNLTSTVNNENLPPDSKRKFPGIATKPTDDISKTNIKQNDNITDVNKKIESSSVNEKSSFNSVRMEQGKSRQRSRTKSMTNASEPVEKQSNNNRSLNILPSDRVEKEHLESNKKKQSIETIVSSLKQNVYTKILDAPPPNHESTDKQKDLLKTVSPNDLLKAVSPKKLLNVVSPGEKTLNVKDTFNFQQQSNQQISNYIENIETNTGTIEKLSQESNKQKKSDTTLLIERDYESDQCVPVIHNVIGDTELLEKKSNKINSPINSTTLNYSTNKNLLSVGKSEKFENNTCEPMDIDETLPDHKSVIHYSSENIDMNSRSSLNITKPFDKNKISKESMISTLNNSRDQNMSNKNSNKTGELTVQDIENKSTLILSQLKGNSGCESPNLERVETQSADSKFENINDCIKDQSLFKDSSDTPQKHKIIHRLGIKTSTPVASPSSNNKSNKSVSGTNSPLKSNSHETHVKDISNEKSNNSSSGDLSDSNELKQRNSWLNEEAEDAGDDYESGDSEDDDFDRQDAEENEIIEKGETLQSEDEISNDTDYERDSFVVSSDDEDKELLSGTGDDLSMSDNELTMSSKSKEKYNKRKLKEQKRASREIFESRHNLNNGSDDKGEDKLKIKKKSNRLRLISPELVSDDSADESGSGKKNRYQNQSKSEGSCNTNESINIKKNKNKRRSQLSLSNSIRSEKEISAIFSESVLHKEDPLESAIKAEPKTPIKANTSTVNVYDLEQVHINENKTMVNADATSDPLQATYEESSLSSENEEIMNNYDSVLNALNNDRHHTRTKKQDISLNFNKKSKEKCSNPIVEQLNLTQPKVQNPQNNLKNTNKIKDKHYECKESYECSDSSSDTIDLKLLFPDKDSDSDNDEQEDKKYSNQPLVVLDTKIKDRNTPKSDKKTKKLPRNVSQIDNTAPIEIAVATQGSSKKNKKRLSESSVIVDQDEQKNASVSKTPKKTKKILESENESKADECVDVAPMPSSSKKKKRRSEYSITDDNMESVDKDKALNDSLINCNTNKIKKTSMSKGDSVDVNQSIKNNVMDSAIKKKNNSISEEVPVNFSLNSSHGTKKKKNKSMSESFNVDQIDGTEVKPVSESVGDVSINKKKKIKKPSDFPDDTVEVSSSVLPNVSQGSNKSKNKRKLHVDEIEDLSIHKLVKAEKEPNICKKRRRKPSGTIELSEEVNAVPIIMDTQTLTAGGQMKKLKFCAGDGGNETKSDEVVKKKKQSEIGESKISEKIPPQLRFKTKKRKKCHDDDDDDLKQSKVMKKSFFNQIHVSRLPTELLDQLEHKAHLNSSKKSSVVSTSDFIVEEAKKRRNKPSNYLEESIYLNDSPEKKITKRIIKKPLKVLPFVPTATISSSGFTTTFKVNVIPQETKFIAQASNVPNFKKDYIIDKKLKKMGTYEKYRKQRSVKLTKF